jgi:hypothetical protein
MQAVDPLTKEPFDRIKQTQRFATRDNQVRFNNRKATEQRRILSPYLKVLYRNRKILRGILGDEPQRVVTKDFLEGAGYAFRYQTHTLNQDNQQVFGVFEYGLIRLPSGQFQVSKLKVPFTQDREDLKPIIQ